MSMKDVIVIGGPNGAGKTTAASRLLPITLDLHEFLNADEIARGLAAIYDNSVEPPVLIAETEPDSSFTVRDSERWKLIEDAISERPHG